MNVRDSEVICGLLAKEGYSFTDDPHNADIILLNTCSVRQHAEDKVWSEIGRYKKGKGTVPIIGLLGCMASNYKDKVFEKAHNLDFAVGPQDLHKIPAIINKLLESGQSPRSGGSPLFQRRIWEADGDLRPDEIYHTKFYANKEHAYIVISEGCSNFCSYCVVPYVRSSLRNRKSEHILREIKEALDCGIKKITLLGQNVNAYQDKEEGFVSLLKKVNDLDSLGEFSFVTSHPKDTSEDLFKVMADLRKLKKSLHLPVQSGSDRILKLMNRGYTRKSYSELVNKYRKSLKNGALSTDIIVGFPSETERDFQDTFDLVKEIEFDSAFIFKYSPRPHTQAQNFPDDVAKDEKERRHKLILDFQKDVSKSAGVPRL